MTGSPGSAWTEVRALFEEMVDLPPAARAERLASLENAELREAVERLLASDQEAGGFLETPAAGLAGELLGAAPGPEDGAPPPERIGAYRVLSRLGRGGMGEVFLAERADGLFEQRVAIKLLRRGMDSEDVLARFSRERQILARLDHPHIARLLDGGAAPDGRPYFVMELVEGETITAFGRARRLSIEDRIRLLLDCCDAVSAAHRNLVVHRDLKPSNVLVTGAGQVKLLDFGIAKVLAEDAAGAAQARTREDTRLLTPAYAAPEQLRGEPVTTATDVWALGALLYELVTGTTPQRRDAGAPADPAPAAEGETIERPSARVAKTPLEALPLGSPTERDRRRLEKRLAGDLDNVLRMALRREPERRYGSAGAFADDLRRHLSGQPVRARPDTLGYRAAKFLRRRRLAVAAAALVLLSLVGGLAATAWQARRAEANARVAASAARRAERVKEFLIGLFEIADPEQSGGSVPARDLLDQAGRRLDTELSAEPDVQADLLEAVARIDRGLGRLDSAETLARRSLAIRQAAPGSDPAGLGRSLATLGAVEMDKGKLEEALKQLERALAIVEAREGPGSLAAARVRSDFAQALFWKGDVARATELEKTVYRDYRNALGEDHVQTAIHRRNLGVLLDELDRLDEAETAFRGSQAVLEKKLGPEHVNLGNSYVNLAVLLERRGKVRRRPKASTRESLEVRRKALGHDHRVVGQSLQLTALFYLNQGRYEEAERSYREALALFRAHRPEALRGRQVLERPRAHRIPARPVRGGGGDARPGDRALRRGPRARSTPSRGRRAATAPSRSRCQGRLAEAEKIQREVADRLGGAERRGQQRGRRGARAGSGRRSGVSTGPTRPSRCIGASCEKQRELLGRDNAVVALARVPGGGGPDRHGADGGPRRGADAARCVARDAPEARRRRTGARPRCTRRAPGSTDRRRRC